MLPSVQNRPLNKCKKIMFQKENRELPSDFLNLYTFGKFEKQIIGLVAMNENIKKIFYPKSLCVAGASTKEKSIGYEILKTIKVYGYTGKVYPVNPHAEEILGYECYESVEKIPYEIDAAVIVTPKKFVKDTVKALLRKGVKALILVTAGFKETGEEGANEEKEIAEMVRKAGANLVGPNCMGMINTHDEIRLNATFVAEKPEGGKIGFLSQSGALGAAVLNSLRTSGIRFAHFISVGNKADLTENEITLYWNEDPNVQILTYYLESFENGKKFLLPFIDGRISKPAIVLKAGRTAGGKRAASSHTGALSAEDSVVTELLRQFGIIRAETVEELFNIAKGFENFPLPKGNRVAVVTNAGGPAILAVDALERRGFNLATLAEETKLKLREIVHPNGSVNNPVDLLPGGNAESYARSVELVLADEGVDAVVSIFVEPVMVEPFGVVEKLNEIKSDKPLMQVVMPLPEFWKKYAEESKRKLPLFRNPEEPAVVLEAMLFFGERRKILEKNADEYFELLRKETSETVKGKKRFLSPEEVKKFLSGKDFPLVEEKIIFPSELYQTAELKFPLVLKGYAKGAIHKTELQGVKLDIGNKEELLTAAKEMEKAFSEAGKFLEYFIAQPFLNFKFELLIGAQRDPSFGAVVVFGSGGKYVEVYRDVAIRSAFLSEDDALDMIVSTKIGKMLLGVRNEKSVDIEPLKKLLQKTAVLMLEHPEVLELDFNPVGVTPDGKIVIVDTRIGVAE